MEIKPIHSEADYQTVLKDISQLMALDPVLGTPEGDRLDVLATLVQAYEAKHYPWHHPTPSKPSNSAWSRAVCPSKTSSP